MSARRRTRTAVSLPSASAASSMFWIWPRPWIVAEGVLGARLVPAHGDAVALGEGHAQQLLGVDVELRAEATADGRGDDADLLFGEAEGDRRHDLEDVRDLRRRVQGDVAAERLRNGGDGPCLHRHRDQPLLDVALLDGVGGGGEGGVDLTLGALDLERPGVAPVGPEIVVDHHAVGQGILEIDDCFERFVLDVDELGGISCGRLRRRHDGGDAVAGVAHLVPGERVVRRVLHVVRDRPGARHRRRPRLGEIGTGVDGDDPVGTGRPPKCRRR